MENRIFSMGVRFLPYTAVIKKSKNYSYYGSFTLGNNAYIGSTENLGLQTIAAV